MIMRNNTTDIQTAIPVIDSFHGSHYWLSNFYEAPVVYNGRHYTSNEAAFQAAKCPGREFEFTTLNPSQAKRLGRRVNLRGDWERVKDEVMYEICKQKFLQNPSLLRKLLATGDTPLIEGNTWGDKYWGVCNGVGHNRLGQILMQIRHELRGITEDFEPVVWAKWQHRAEHNDYLWAECSNCGFRVENYKAVEVGKSSTEYVSVKYRRCPQCEAKMKV